MTSRGFQLERVGQPAERAADLILQRVHATLEAQRSVTLALSGGSSPLPMLDALARARADWDRIHILQVDERVAPDCDPDRNSTALLQRLVEPAGIPMSNVHLMAVGTLAPHVAASTYAHLLGELTATDAPVLDVVHLGLGTDGHTASLVPGDPVLRIRDRDIASTAPYAGRPRVTMTYPLLNRARTRVWLVTGADKADALAGLLAGDPSLPSTGIEPTGSIVVTDLP